MSQHNSENKKVIAETEIGNNGVGHSKMHGESGVDLNKATSDDLKLALVISQNENARLRAELEAKKSSSSDSSIIKELAELLSQAIVTNSKPVGPTEEDNINRTSAFKEQVHRIDGNSLMEAQSTMLAYRNENKVPVSVPKTFQSQFGHSLDITVNGVRVSIPCDGKMYYINETHAIHARERIAKVDRMLSDTEPHIVEIDA